MRISDWSSDVCSSDLPCAGLRRAVTDLAVDPFAFSGGHGPAFAIAASELAGTVDRGRRGGGRAGRCLLVELAPVPCGSLSDLARVAAPVARQHPGDRKSTRLNSSPQYAHRMLSSACKKKKQPKT